MIDLSTPPAQPVEWRVRRVVTADLHIEYTRGREPRVHAKTAHEAKVIAAQRLAGVDVIAPSEVEVELA